MAFLRFNRDKRGYEHFYLVEPVTNRRGKTRARVLYWFRTPPNVRVGRAPFDEAAQRELEAQNPGVTFDWRRIIETPIPSAETDRWRERRRAERAEKTQRGSRAEIDGRSEAIDEPPDDTAAAESDVVVADRGAAAVEVDHPPEPAKRPIDVQPTSGHRKRRRRRRKRNGAGGSPQGTPASAEAPVSRDGPEPSDPTGE